MELPTRSSSIPCGTHVADRMILLAWVDGSDLMANGARTGATAYLVPCDDPHVLRATIQALRQGLAPPAGTEARVVELRLDPDHMRGQGDVLSPREKEVMRALVEGLSYKMIAERLCIGFETVRSHVKNIHGKLQVHNSTEAVAKTLKAGLI